MVKRQEELDEKDVQIIKMLRENARTPYAKIAEGLGVSDVAVLKRIRRLERQGVIKKYTIEVDLAKLGYRVSSFTGLDVSSEHLFRVVEFLKSKDYVRYLAITTGDHSLIAEIVAGSNEELARIHEELSGLPGVRRVCPAIVMEVVKS